MAKPFDCFPLFDEAASTIAESSLEGSAGEEAGLPVPFDVSEPPDVNGKGGKLRGSELAELPASVPPRPGNEKVLPLFPNEGDSDDGGAAEEDSESVRPGTETKFGC